MQEYLSDYNTQVEIFFEKLCVLKKHQLDILGQIIPQ